MNLPSPPQGYDRSDQAQTRRLIEQADNQNRKVGQDVPIGRARLILTSPNGSRWSVTVGDDGVLSASAVG